MVYLATSLASIVLLGAGLGVIGLTVRTSHGRILAALLGQPVDRPVIAVRAVRSRERLSAPARRLMQPMRAAA